MRARKARSVRAAVIEFLTEQTPAIVDRGALDRIRRHIAATCNRPRPPSKSYILDILLSTDVPVDRAIGGIPVDLRGRVRTASLEDTKRSLLEMTREYEAAPDRRRAGDVRRAVVRTKDHLKLALAGGISPEKRPAKEETLRWLLVWLENPGIFESWVALREMGRRSRRPADDRAPDGASSSGPD